MNTIYMTSKNSKTADPNRVIDNLSDKIDLKKSDKYVIFKILTFAMHREI